MLRYPIILVIPLSLEIPINIDLKIHYKISPTNITRDYKKILIIRMT